MPFPETGAEAAPASTWARLLRGAHSLSLAADPAFVQRMPRLFRQLEEVGLAKKLGYGHGDDIVAAYPRLFLGAHDGNDRPRHALSALHCPG